MEATPFNGFVSAEQRSHQYEKGNRLLSQPVLEGIASGVQLSPQFFQQLKPDIPQLKAD